MENLVGQGRGRYLEGGVSRHIAQTNDSYQFPVVFFDLNKDS